MRLLSRIRNGTLRLVMFIRLYSEHLPLALQMLFNVRCRVVLFSGRTIGEGNPLNLLYVGRNYNCPFILKSVFSEYKIREEKRSYLFSYKRHAARLAPAADMVLYDIGWPYHWFMNRKGRFLELPDWVRMSVDIGDTWEETRQQFMKTIRRNELRYIRIEGYRCEETSDRKAVAKFYDEMYRPFIRSKHGADAVKASRRHVIRRGSQGCLQQIYREDRLVAAGVVLPEDDVLYFLWIGLAADCMDDPPRAVMSALYYHGIRHAFEHGYEAVDFTGTRASFNTGVYRFKRKWGAGVSDSFSPSSILVKPVNGNPASAAFCREFPMLARRESGPEWMFLTDQPIDKTYLEKIYSNYECDGISRLCFIGISGEKTDVSGIDLESLNSRVTHASLDTFADHYRKNPKP